MVKTLKLSGVTLLISLSAFILAGGGTLDRCLDRCDTLGTCIVGSSLIGAGVGVATGTVDPGIGGVAAGCGIAVSGMVRYQCREKCRRMYPPVAG